LLQWDVIGESSLTCNDLVPCGEAQVEFFGFATIPFGAFIFFSVITILMIAQLKYGKKITADFKQQLELLLGLIAATIVALLFFVVIRSVFF